MSNFIVGLKAQPTKVISFVKHYSSRIVGHTGPTIPTLSSRKPFDVVFLKLPVQVGENNQTLCNKKSSFVFFIPNLCACMNGLISQKRHLDF